MEDQRTLEQHKQSGQVRTDLYCHNCNKNFVAELDYDIDGQHTVECPYCGHEHCRYINNGFISDKRWAGHNDTVKVVSRCVWKHDVLKAKTSVASEFLRNRWLNFGT